MKRMFLLLCVLSVCVIPSLGVKAQNAELKNIFSGYKRPIAIGILKFEGEGNFEQKLFSALKNDEEVKKNFEISSYESINKVKSGFGIKNLNPNDKGTLHKLKSQMDIEFVVAGSANDNSVELKIIRTSDGDEVFNNTFGSENKIENIISTFSNFEIYSTNTSKVEKKVINSNSSSNSNSGMVYVEGGSFEMGCEEGENSERPVHRVFVNSFYIDKYEVTQAEYEKVMLGANPSYDEKNPVAPVSDVSWSDANKYARKVGKRLPTEAEWEYAARGGKYSKNYIFSGSDNINSVAWYNDNSGLRLHEVGTKQPNELGLFDMSGNVWEWCSDYFDEKYYSHSPSNNPKGPKSGKVHVLRGGGIRDYGNGCHVFARSWNYMLFFGSFGGIRCVK